MGSETRLIVLDRDGVINRDSESFVKSPAEWHALRGSLEAIARLCRGGYKVAVATNQSGVGRGLFTEETLEDIHRTMREAVARAGGRIDCIVYCPHPPDAGCDCRKPRPGLLRQLERHYGRSLAGVPVVGDSERDLRAAEAVGACPILVLTGKGTATRARLSGANGEVSIYPDLAAVAAALTGRG